MSAYEEAKANLNKAVLCPDCDNTGCIPTQIAEGEWEPMQCEFCYCVEDSLFNRRTEFIQAADKEIATKDAELARLREEVQRDTDMLALIKEAAEKGATLVITLANHNDS